MIKNVGREATYAGAQSSYARKKLIKKTVFTMGVCTFLIN